MVARPRPGGTARRRHPSAPSPAPDHAPSSQRWFGYLLLIRGGAFERHTRTCTHCAPGSELAAAFGPCPTGMRLAARADSAHEAYTALAPPPERQRATAGTLW